MERTPHVLFVGKTGEETLVALGAEDIDDPSSYFAPAELSENASPNEGTVGAVALDQHGHSFRAGSVIRRLLEPELLQTKVMRYRRPVTGKRSFGVAQHRI
jgi:hypothetical protein